MQVLDLKQGTQEWSAVRFHHPTASEAPIMMRVSPKASRSDLVARRATGDEQTFSRWVEEVLFERGHAVEAAARPIAERLVGEELYPVVAVDDDGYLLASFDGVTMLEDKIWECKQWNEDKAAAVAEGMVPDEDYWQVVQQLVVSGAEECLYMVTDGDEDRTVSVWVALAEGDEQALRAGWEQFQRDVDAYVPREEPVEAIGTAPEALPALHIEVTGAVNASNLPAFRAHALAVFDSINTDLRTDQDFADAEKTVKWCGEVERRLEAAKDHALAQTSDIDALFRALDGIREQARAKRLDLSKRVEARKKEIRGEILVAGKEALAAHLGELEAALVRDGAPRVRLDAHVKADFAAAMKGKRTVRSLKGAVEDTLAQAKIDAAQLAERVRANTARVRELAGAQYRHLFADIATLVAKAPEDCEAAVRARVAEAEAARAKEAAEAQAAREKEAAAAKAAQEQAARERPVATPAAAPPPPRPAPQAWVHPPAPEPEPEAEPVLCEVGCVLIVETPAVLDHRQMLAHLESMLPEGSGIWVAAVDSLISVESDVAEETGGGARHGS